MTMQKTTSHRNSYVEALTQVAPGRICIGRILGTDERGNVLVEFDGSGPRAAKLVERLGKLKFSQNRYIGREVLIVFEGEGAECPILLDLMADPLKSLLSIGLCVLIQLSTSGSVLWKRAYTK